jgi:hypothetical protein
MNKSDTLTHQSSSDAPKGASDRCVHINIVWERSAPGPWGHIERPGAPSSARSARAPLGPHQLGPPEHSGVQAPAGPSCPPCSLTLPSSEPPRPLTLTCSERSGP